MRCPECGSKTHIIDSRPTDRGWRRRRECDRLHRFTTFEFVGTEKGLQLEALARAKREVMDAVVKRLGEFE